MITRREAAKSATLTALSYSRIAGANDRIGLGVIGTGGRGTYVMTVFQKNADVEVRALCDVYGVRIDQAQQKAPGTKAFGDHRELLACKEVDAVLIASPDHWHKDHAVDAMNAGKDVYVEKPMCRTREEAPQMVRAARVTGRICQVGVQQRFRADLYRAPGAVHSFGRNRQGQPRGCRLAYRAAAPFAGGARAEAFQSRLGSLPGKASATGTGNPGNTGTSALSSISTAAR